MAKGDIKKMEPRKRRQMVKGQMTQERNSFIAHYKDLSEYFLPRRGRFLTSDRNRGDKRHQAIINSTGTKALGIATSGMLAGSMSPTRPWFSMETQDPELMERQDVKEWLHKVERLLRAILNESNFYGQASSMLSELLLFGTGVMLHVDDFEDVARFYTQTAGSYAIAQDSRYEVDTLFREFQMTAMQMVEMFGYENVSRPVKEAVEKANYQTWFDVCHLIEPNDEFRPGSPRAENFPYSSTYYEPGAGEPDDPPYLRRSGFMEKPFHAIRWDVTGEDVYGTNCPGIQALGDVKGMQVQEKRKAQAIDKMVSPPLRGPASVRNVPLRNLPGGLTVYDGMGEAKLEPVYTVDPRLQELRADIMAIENRVNSAFFVDLFMAISTMEGIQPRNQLDLMQRNEERLLQLGPVLERLHGEFLSPLIDRLYSQCERARILPDPPEVLEGSDLKIKYISTLAQAQRAVATQSIDRMALFAGNLAAAGWTQALDKFDPDQAIDEYGQAVGAPPKTVVPDEVVAQRRAQRQAQQQAAQMAQLGESVSKTASNLASAKTDDESVLTDAMEGADGQ